jgi:hypothetical protein
VPTGVATIALPDQAAIFVNKSVTLGAVKLTGNMTLVVMPKVSMTAMPGGFTVCCGQAKINLSDGEVTGDVTIGSATAPTENQVGGTGTINGTILHYGGTFGAGASAASRQLNVAGDYRSLGPNTGFVSNVVPEGPTAVRVTGIASIGNATLVIYIDNQVTGQIPPYKVLTARRI